MGMPGFTAEASMYPSTRYYVMTPSAASVRDSGLVSMAACTNPLNAGGTTCFPTFNPNLFISVCDCDGTCGTCTDLGFPFGNKQICPCTPSSPGGWHGGRCSPQAPYCCDTDLTTGLCTMCRRGPQDC